MKIEYPVLGLSNPKFAPLEDNGVVYRYEDNPATYRRIRK